MLNVNKDGWILKSSFYFVQNVSNKEFYRIQQSLLNNQKLSFRLTVCKQFIVD